MVGERHDAIPPLKGARGIYLNPKNPPNPLGKSLSRWKSGGSRTN